MKIALILDENGNMLDKFSEREVDGFDEKLIQGATRDNEFLLIYEDDYFTTPPFIRFSKFSE